MRDAGEAGSRLLFFLLILPCIIHSREKFVIKSWGKIGNSWGGGKTGVNAGKVKNVSFGGWFFFVFFLVFCGIEWFGGGSFSK